MRKGIDPSKLGKMVFAANEKASKANNSITEERADIRKYYDGTWDSSKDGEMKKALLSDMQKLILNHPESKRELVTSAFKEWKYLAYKIHGTGEMDAIKRHMDSWKTFIFKTVANKVEIVNSTHKCLKYGCSLNHQNPVFGRVLPKANGGLFGSYAPQPTRVSAVVDFETLSSRLNLSKYTRYSDNPLRMITETNEINSEKENYINQYMHSMLESTNPKSVVNFDSESRYLEEATMFDRVSIEMCLPSTDSDFDSGAVHSPGTDESYSQEDFADTGISVRIKHNDLNENDWDIGKYNSGMKLFFDKGSRVFLLAGNARNLKHKILCPDHYNWILQSGGKIDRTDVLNPKQNGVKTPSEFATSYAPYSFATELSFSVMYETRDGRGSLDIIPFLFVFLHGMGMSYAACQIIRFWDLTKEATRKEVTQNIFSLLMVLLALRLFDYERVMGKLSVDFNSANYMRCEEFLGFISKGGASEPRMASCIDSPIVPEIKSMGYFKKQLSAPDISSLVEGYPGIQRSWGLDTTGIQRNDFTVFTIRT